MCRRCSVDAPFDDAIELVLILPSVRLRPSPSDRLPGAPRGHLSYPDEGLYEVQNGGTTNHDATFHRSQMIPPLPRRYTIGLIQMSVSKDADENLRRTQDMIRTAASRGARGICLPELFRSRYFCQREDVTLFDLAESVPGPSTGALGPLAQSLGVVIVVPVFERRGAGVYHNSAAILDADGTIAGFYRKMHIPDDPAYYEKFYFTPGDLGFRAFDTAAGRIGTLICWDQWYPEGARLTALQGADVLFYPTAIGWHPHEKVRYGAAQHDAWRTVQRGHAIANGVYVAAVNRIGHEISSPGGPGIEFWGSSFIADPQGVILAEASTDREEILIAEVDTARIEDVRRNWPFLRDRRIDAYDGITRRFLNDEPWSPAT